MPRAIDPSVWSAIEGNYLHRKDVSYTSLAKEYGVSLASIKKKASKEGWKERRDRAQAEKDAVRVEASVKAGRILPRVDPCDALRFAISDLKSEGAATDAKSKEGCYSTMGALMKVERELFPPNADDLADMAVRLGIGPDEFLEALRRKWESQVTEQPVNA